MNAADQARLELIDEFRGVAQERVDKINLAWIAIEGDPANAASAEELLRQLHTLKGEAKMMGFADMSMVAHHTEELVLAAQQRGFQVPDRFGDHILAAADTISHLIHKKAGAQERSIDLTAVIDRIGRALAELAGRSGDPSSLEIREPVPSVAAQIPPLPGTTGSERELLPAQSLRVGARDLGLLSELAGEAVVAHVRYEHGVRELKRLALDSEAALGSAQTLIRATRTGPAAGRATPVPEADALLVGHLREFSDRLRSIVQVQDQLVCDGANRARELERRARDLRLVPIGPLLGRLRRAIRDLAREHGKSVVVDLDGGELTVDKTIADHLVEPLIHLVRNCVDHGIESPDERSRAGKPEAGRITLSAAREGGLLVVGVADDGRGVDATAVRTRARALGMATEREAEGLDDDECIDLLFRSGLSTRTAATETSGRGVGLNVVKQQIESIGGSVRVHSRPGRGARFELRAPISLALTRVLLVGVGDETYAIPSSAIQGVLVMDSTKIRDVHNRKAIRFRDRLVTLVDLAPLVGAPSISGERVVVVCHGDRWAAVVVSEWRHEEEVVVKRLGPLLDGTRLLTGACLLQTAQLVLVLNPVELLGRASTGATSYTQAQPLAPRAEQKRILLVEDSAITRSMLARILAILDYQVAEAEDGQVALRLLEAHTVHAILTDIDMPIMNGMELIQRVRSDSRWRNLPIIVLSTHGSNDDKRRAVEAGADAYLVKNEFSEQALRDVIARQVRR